MRTSRRAVRALRFGCKALLALAVILAGGAWWIFVRPEPQYAGRVVLPGLSAPVQVVRDEYGIPHVFARTLTDAARVLGYLHASERLFQMEMQRRAGQGRLAEVVGAAGLPADRWVRTLGLYDLARSSVAALSAETRELLDDYAQGVNDWLAANKGRLPPEFALLHLSPEPWQPADSVVWGKLMALQLSANFHLEVLRAELARAVSPSMAQRIFPASPPPGPVTVAPHAASAGARAEPAPAVSEVGHSPVLSEAGPAGALSEAGPSPTLREITGLGPGASNEWVIAGARTASGKPILANDPHLGLHAPVLWYLARIDTPDLWIKGATVPGMPMVLLGQNSHIAWGLTTTDSDTQDLFIETVDPADPRRYLAPAGPQPFAVRVETIHVKGAADEVLRVRATRHGPVVSDVNGELAGVAGAGRVLALRFTALDGHDTTAEALVRLNRARDWESFLDALQPYMAPPQNFVYADTDGHIGFVNAGRVPARHEGEGLVPVDGTRDGHEWESMVPFAALPQLRDPPAGFIFNANNAVTDRTTPYFFGIDWEEPYRAQRLQHFFDTIARHSLETSAAMQMDTMSPVAQELLPHLLRQRPDSPRAAAALALLKNWDGAMGQARPEPLIFEAWLYEMHRKLLVEKAGLPLEAKGPYFATAIAAILDADDRDWCGANGCAPIITAAFGDALAMLQTRLGEDMAKWTWGREHVSRLDNIFFSRIPVLSKLTDLSVPSSGGFYALDRGEGWSADPREPFARRDAAGYRAIYDLGDPDASRFVIATGESAHVFSRHYGDMVPLWNSGRYVTLAGTRETLAARGLPELDFVPAPPRQ